MKLNPSTRYASLICATVIVLVCGAQLLARFWPRFDFFPRLEWITYDARVRWAAERGPLTATNLGYVFINDDSIEAVQDGYYGNLPYRFGLYWPRQVYGRLVNELSAQGATAVGFDILFADLRPDHQAFRQADGTEMDSDQFFAAQIQHAGNVILAAKKGTPTHALFRTNALHIGDITARPEPDGILRRAKAYQDVYLWHPLIKDAGRTLGWDLTEARVEANRIVFPLAGQGQYVLALTNGHEFNQVQLFEEMMEKLTGKKPPPQTAQPWSAAFVELRCWQMGIALAAHAVGLDLAGARVEPERGRIVLTGTNGLTRVIPIDAEGYFPIDWSLTPHDPTLTKESIESLLVQYEQRQAGQLGDITNRWKGKLVVVGSLASGNDLTDLGATPLEKETWLFSQQWNIANSILTGRFVRPPTLTLELALIIVLGTLAGWLSWNLRVLTASTCVLGGALLYAAVATWLFLQWRWWLPVVLPVGGSLLVLHASMVTYRVIHEQRERRHVKAVFEKIVSPNVVQELLQATQLDFRGVRREVTVMFADIRGFTEMTDASQARAEERVHRLQLTGPTAEVYNEAQAREVLTTVNLYLSLLADMVKQHQGTLDKYIGDCVMAFWGAPTPNQQHARSCVRAAIDAQQAIQKLNQQRAAENQRREAENVQRVAQGEEPWPKLAVLDVGIGINTGLVTVGLIGSEAHILNYTVFGREVNVASRLQEVARAGRIIIAETTRRGLERDDPPLAAACGELSPVQLKGIAAPVQNYAVKWDQGT